MENPKEVRYDKYCPNCKYNTVTSSVDPGWEECDRCMEESVREGTEVPSRFRRKE